MSKSKIEWTEVTWNPVTGCEKVSPGCDHCYALQFSGRWQSMAQADRRRQGVQKYLGTVEAIEDRVAWSGQVFTHPEELLRPARWKGPRMIFVCSMSDLFHYQVGTHFLDRVFTVMHENPQHTYQVLTKRPLLAYEWNRDSRVSIPDCTWVGVTAETQGELDRRLGVLLRIEARTRWLSCEPLLGPIVLPEDCGIDWVVAGGESGKGARPMDPAWALSLRDQCMEQGIPFFFKQWGAWAPAPKRVGKWSATRTRVLPGGQVMVLASKTKNGRRLDGREYNEYPRGGSDGLSAV